MKIKISLYFLLFTIFFGFLIYFGIKKFVVAPRRVEIIKGIVGQPHLLNPLYAELAPVDNEISSLLFRGLVKYNEKGEIVGDLAESWEITEDGKVYTFKLKPDILWHDRESFRADDVIFTFRLAQEDSYQGPKKDSFAGVTIEKVDEQTVKFFLKEPFSPFLDRLTLGILPKHQLFSVSAEELPRDGFNLNPIGTGNWQFAGLKLNSAAKTISSVTLLPLTTYHPPDGGPVTSLLFRFYESEEDLITAFKLGEINTFATINPYIIAELKDWPNVKISNETKEDTSFALFFNLKGKEVLQNHDFRKGLATAIDKEKLPGQPIDSPIPPLSWAFLADVAKYPFDLEKAKTLLAQFSEEEKILKLKFCENDFCQNLAEEIVNCWREVEVKVEVEKLSKTELAEVVKSRDFEVLLLQQNFSFDPDQYGLWHSSQIETPGSNITGFNNRRVDKFLTDARKTLNQDERKNAYHEIQKEITAELPAIFLIQPKIYSVSAKKVNLDGLNL